MASKLVRMDEAIGDELVAGFLFLGTLGSISRGLGDTGAAVGSHVADHAEVGQDALHAGFERGYQFEELSEVGGAAGALDSRRGRGRCRISGRAGRRVPIGHVEFAGRGRVHSATAAIPFPSAFRHPIRFVAITIHQRSSLGNDHPSNGFLS